MSTEDPIMLILASAEDLAMDDRRKLSEPRDGRVQMSVYAQQVQQEITHIIQLESGEALAAVYLPGFKGVYRDQLIMVPVDQPPPQSEQSKGDADCEKK